MKRMRGILWLIGALLLSVAPVVAQDGFYVIGGGGGVGTKISSLPYTITKPGFYYLDRDITTSTGQGISVQIMDPVPGANNSVTIDLMGFCLQSTSNNGVAIYLPSGSEVRNGTLRGWYSGVMSGEKSRVLNLRILDCTGDGIAMMLNGTVKGCTVGKEGTPMYRGIMCDSGVISSNTVNNASSGIVGAGTISGNHVSYCDTGISSWRTSSIIGNTIESSSTVGISVNYGAYLVAQNSVTVSPEAPPFHASPEAMVVKVNNAGF